MKEKVLIIPVYQPELKFIGFITECQKHFENIIVVNDGSDGQYNKVFKDIENLGVKVICHNINMGKGKALKTAFGYILDNNLNYNVIVTADCDGQHLVEDIVKCVDSVNGNELVLGVRKFDNHNMPLLNRIGNGITRFVFNKIIGLKISDTQTGLRAFNDNLMQQFINVSGDRFEYETNMLLYCKNNNIPIKEIIINTIYDRDGYRTHFNKMKDSISIYINILKNKK